MRSKNTSLENYKFHAYLVLFSFDGLDLFVPKWFDTTNMQVLNI